MPQNKVCYPVDIKHIFRNVNDVNNILSKEGTITLTYDTNDSDDPKLILDLGRTSVGGHLVFSIKSFTGEKPVLRFLYSDWYDYIIEPNYCEMYDGTFSCSDPRLTNLWYASAWTCQIATIPNSNTWDNLNNTLLLRTLAKGNDAGIYKDGKDLTDYTLSFDGAIFRNPQMCSVIGALVRATDLTNGYVVYLNLDGTLEFTDDSYKAGSFGFCQTSEKWVIAKNLLVTNNEKTIFSDDFSGTLDVYGFTRSAPFISDGAKRDRLPWIGDLDWAGRNIYYAFKDFKAMSETLRMFAFNQTPAGYICGTCYPGNTIKPVIADYGYYESDFSPLG